ncbi:hypothetical protein [Chlamydiifrater phoenicopteri]|uniref:hypothetical protein n=1 Tax=Chlamydiifrater phoenicopteri TaxID=2681469 RepID=UPI001BCFEE8F|nr:hypothetical protein [Chlamydiifrater phoenicopteri]
MNFMTDERSYRMARLGLAKAIFVGLLVSCGLVLSWGVINIGVLGLGINLPHMVFMGVMLMLLASSVIGISIVARFQKSFATPKISTEDRGIQSEIAQEVVAEEDLGSEFSLEEEFQRKVFLSTEESLKILSEIEAERDFKKKIDLASQVALGGGFLKKEVLDNFEFFSDEMKLAVAFPQYAQCKLHHKRISLSGYSSLEGWIAKDVKRLFSREKQARAEEFFDREVFPQRFFLELISVSLGFFCLYELDLLREFVCQKVADRELSEGFCNQLYSELIVRFPKVVAVEAVFLNWLKELFPHIPSCEQFKHYRLFLLNGFVRFSEFPRNAVIKFLDKFSGVLPACVLLFHDNGITDFDGVENLSWEEFVQKAMTYFRRARSFKEYEENFGWFSSFLEYGEAIFCGGQVSIPFRKGESNFVERPYPLWNLGALVARDKRLQSKIKEGLRVLGEIECLGGEVDELIALELTVLGLDKSFWE